MNEVDRHDLDGLKELMEAKFDGVERTLGGMNEALKVAAVERRQKDNELNEVRLRFVDRITFDQYKESQERALDAALLVMTDKIKPLDDFRARAMGFGALLAICSSLVGAGITAVIVKAIS
jgi:superfamily I DNA and RNA helicase